MRAVIFSNGDGRHLEEDRSRIQPDDWIIAADGGAKHCLALGITPQVLIGDMDSLEDADLEALRQRGVTLIQHPTQKDETDLELALRLAVGRTQEILVLAGLGARWDQSLANILIGAQPEFAGASIRLISGPQEVRLLHPGSDLRIEGAAGDLVSLIPLCADASGVTTRNLSYPLDGEALRFGATRGVSNEMTADAATVSLSAGILAVVHIRNTRDEF